MNGGGLLGQVFRQETTAVLQIFRPVNAATLHVVDSNDSDHVSEIYLPGIATDRRW